MMRGVDSIDDADLPRAGGTPRVFDEVYAPSTLGIFLREFTRACQPAGRGGPPASGGAGRPDAAHLDDRSPDWTSGVTGTAA